MKLISLSNFLFCYSDQAFNPFRPLKKFLACLSITITAIIFSCPCFANIYYVNTTGSGTNPGTLAQPWSIVYAFANLNPGDTVYVKTGNYGAVNLVIQNSNTSFIGYTNFPGDLDASKQPDSLNTYITYNYSTIYPTLNRNNRVNGGSGINFGSWKTNVTIKNFQILNYTDWGINIVGEGNRVENILINGIGDVNQSYSGTGIATYGNRNKIYKCFVLNGAAEGINLRGDSNIVSFSKVYSTDTSTIYSLTDYYVFIAPNSQTKMARGNLIDNCYAERISFQDPTKGHLGHGFSITMSYQHQLCSSGAPGTYCYDPTQRLYSARDNTISNCTTKNIFEPVMLRGDGVRYNHIENMISLSFGGLSIQNSCRYNTFNRCRIMNTYCQKNNATGENFRFGAVRFSASYYGDSTATNIGSNENNSFPWEQQYSGSYNQFTNCVFENVACGIHLDYYGEMEYPFYHPLAGKAIDRVNRKRIVGNDFINCTFTGRQDTADILFEAERGNTQNQFINCIITGFKNFESRSYPSISSNEVVTKEGIIPTDFTYANCLFYNNGFDGSVPANGVLSTIGTGPLLAGFSNAVAGRFVNNLVNVDPKFKDAANHDFHLSVTSPCIDKGSTINLNTDYENNNRPCNGIHDIGAYEFSNCISTPPPVADPVRIFPNPNHGIFEVISNDVLIRVQVFALDGRKVADLATRESRVNMILAPAYTGIFLVKTISINNNSSILTIMVK